MKYKEIRTTSFNWWNANDTIDESTAIPLKHCPQLKESAMSRINEMLAEGYLDGELLDEIEGINYRGWWSVTIKEIP